VSESERKTIRYVRLDSDFANPGLRGVYEGMEPVKAGRKRINGKDYALTAFPVSGSKSSWPRMRVM